MIVPLTTCIAPIAVNRLRLKMKVKYCYDNSPNIDRRHYAYIPGNYLTTGKPDYTPTFKTKKELERYLKQNV